MSNAHIATIIVMGIVSWGFVAWLIRDEMEEDAEDQVTDPQSEGDDQ